MFSQTISQSFSLTYLQARHVYSAWRKAPGAPAEAARVQAEYVERISELLGGAMPTPQPGESLEEAMSRALSGHLSNNPLDLLSGLSRALLPQPLVQEIRLAGHPRLVIHPCPALANVPWALLPVDVSGERPMLLGEIADICYPISGGTETTPNDTGPVATVLDPRIPGAHPAGPLGSVLGRPNPEDTLAALVRLDTHPAVTTYPELARRRDVTAEGLREACAGARRLLFVGHVAEGGLHLGDTQPLRPEDLDEGWRMPARVALVACGSASDKAWPEACHARGAEQVVAMQWHLPTDANFEGEPFRRLVLAVDRAQDSADPVAELTRWQTESFQRYLATGDDNDHPLLVGAAMTYVGAGHE